MNRKTWLLVVTGLCVAVLSVTVPQIQNAQADGPAVVKAKPKALKRTRKTVQMLDSIYKQAIVLITDKYVHDEDDFPAGSAAVVWFKAISKQGSHQVRLLDATGDPIEESNVAKDAFEKEGIRKLKEGANYVDEVVKIDGKLQLRALTPVPVVMKKCIMCHAHYADVAKGAPIGAISYTIPIE